MINEFAVIYLLFVLLALCIASVAIINVREKKSRLLTEKPDFVEAFYLKKKKMLETNLPMLSIKAYIALLTLTPFVFIILFWMLFPNKVFAVFIGACGVFLPDFIIRILVENKKKKFEEKYVRALKSLSSALKSGLSIQQAVRDTLENPFVAEDIKEGFRQISSDMQVGISVEQAFNLYAEKVDNDDARDVASAIAMQMDVGGSEAAVIETIAKNIEDRLLTRQKIRAIFASTEYMVNAFDVIPFLVVITMYLGVPDYMEPMLSNPVTLLLYVSVLAFTIYGSFAIRRKINVAKGG